MEDVPKLAVIADRINAHLKRFERDPAINLDTSPDKRGLRTFYYAGAHASGAKVFVTYITYQGATSLSKNDALRYLAWLDAGNVGRHFEALHA